MGFCQWAEVGPKVGFWVQKRVKMGQPTLDPFEDIDKNPILNPLFHFIEAGPDPASLWLFFGGGGPPKRRK